MGIIETTDDVSARVMALYGKPGFRTWTQIARTLRIPRGSAWSLAHGLRKSDPRTVGYLECAEFRIYHLREAAANLAELIGVEPPTPTIFMGEDDERAGHANKHRTKGEGE